MRTVNDHLEELLAKLNVERLVAPDTKDKKGVLERECGKIERILLRMLAITRKGKAAAEKLGYLNEAMPGEQLGDRLIDASFVELRKKHLLVDCLAGVVDYAAARVTAHYRNGTYDPAYLESDKKIAELPASIAALTANQTNVAINFLTYLKAVALDAPWEKFPELYQEFQEIVIDGIIASKVYAGILHLRELEASWERIRELQHDDPEALKWIAKFEALETKYKHRNLPQLEKLYREQS